jgi:hypothetical protein
MSVYIKNTFMQVKGGGLYASAVHSSFEKFQGSRMTSPR